MTSIKTERLCRGLPGQKKQEDISKKKNRENSARGMAQVTEHLSSKCKNPKYKLQYCQPLLHQNKNTIQRHIELSVSNMHCKAIH
jgi:hypothetical protein